MRKTLFMALLAFLFLRPATGFAQPAIPYLPAAELSGAAATALPELWDAVAKLDSAVVSGDSAGAETQLAVVLDWKSRLSARNLFFVSRMLTARANMQGSAGNTAGARKTAGYARRISPDDSGSWFAVSRYAYLEDIADFKGWLDPAYRGADAWLANPLNRKILAFASLTTAVWGLAFAFMLFSLAVFIAFIKPIAHDVRRMAPVELGETGAISVIILILVSFLFGMGFMAAFAALALVLTGYLKARGRIMLALFIAVFAAMPFIIPVIGGGMALEFSRPARTVSHFMNEGWEPGEIKDMEELARLYPDDDAVLVMVGGYYRKMGNYELAQQYLQQALAKDDRNVWAIVEMGNVNFGRGEFREAELMYKNAIGLSPALFEGHFNLGNTYIQVFRTEEAQKEMDAATGLNKEKADLLLSAKNEKSAVRVVSVTPATVLPVSVERIVARDGARIARKIWTFFMPFLDREQYRIAAIGYIAAFALSIILWGKFGAHTHCASCGETFYPMFIKTEKGGVKCDRCVALGSAQKTTIIGPKDKIRAGIREHHAGRRNTANRLNMILPGVGSVWYGSHIAGAILVSATGVFAARAFAALFDAAAGYRIEPVAAYIAWGAAALLYYAVAAPLSMRRK